MAHPFKHLVTITKHRHQVLANASHMGIFFFALHHDLSKLNPKEFIPSAKYYAGTFSPVYNQRLHEHYFSSICQHHVRRNPHHWEYWVDFYNGFLLMKTMPYKWACEYVCDMLSASKVYSGKSFNPSTTVEYFKKRSTHYYLTKASHDFIEWCLETYATKGWKALKKKATKAKYLEIIAKNPEVEVIDHLRCEGELPRVD